MGKKGQDQFRSHPRRPPPRVPRVGGIGELPKTRRDHRAAGIPRAPQQPSHWKTRRQGTDDWRACIRGHCTTVENDKENLKKICHFSAQLVVRRRMLTRTPWAIWSSDHVFTAPWTEVRPEYAPAVLGSETGQRTKKPHYMWKRSVWKDLFQHCNEMVASKKNTNQTTA